MDDKRPRNPDGTYQSIHQPPTTEELESFGRAGLNNQQMASILGMSKDTLERFFASDSVLHAAVEKGRSNSILKVASTAYQLAVSGDVPAMTMFYLKTRAGWKETQVVEQKPDDDTISKVDKGMALLERIAKKPNE